MKNLNLQSAGLKYGRPRLPTAIGGGVGAAVWGRALNRGACADSRQPGHRSASIEKRTASLVAQW